MNKILLVCSHLESGSDCVVSNLNSGSKLQKLNFSYNDPYCLFSKKTNFEYRKRPKYGFDHILYNHEFTCKNLFQFIYFVYIIGDPKKTITNLVYKNIYDQKIACNYYCFRIRRIYEMIKNSKNYLLFFEEDLVKEDLYFKIQKMLGIRDKLKIKIKPQEKIDIKIEKSLMDETEAFYEKYRYECKSFFKEFLLDPY
jgi:hypothetical protein